MNIITIDAAQIGCTDAPLLLGYAGENSVEAVDFDFSSWAEEYGAGAITLEIMRASDTAPYTPLLTIDGTTARWTISDVDTARRGPGVAQFIYTPEDKKKKSAVFKFYVGKSIRSDDDADPWQDLLNRLEELLGEMQQQAADTRENAEAADQSAQAADQSAQDAASSESNAEAWAVGERGGEPVSESDPTYENNAKYWAENISGQLEDYRTAADQDAIDSAQDGKINALTNLLNKKQSKITANGILKGDGNGGISAAVPGMDYLPTSALYAYRSAIKQDEIDNAQNANIAKNADDIADVKTTADTALQPAALAPYRTAADQDTIDNAQAADIAAINDKIPSTASKNNKLVAWSTFNGQLGTKQAKITANGILKGDGAGGVSAAVAGTDYLAPSALDAYRTAAAQDEIDAAQDADIDDLKSAIENFIINHGNLLNNSSKFVAPYNDFNTFKQNECVLITTNPTNYVANIPNGFTAGWVLTFNYKNVATGGLAQIVFYATTTAKGRIAWRKNWGSTWDTWYYFDNTTDIVTTLNASISAVSTDATSKLVLRGYNEVTNSAHPNLTDADNAEVNRIYSIQGANVCANLPESKQGTLITFNYKDTGGGKVQLFHAANGVLYSRIYWSAWRDWIKYTSVEEVDKLLNTAYKGLGNFIACGDSITRSLSYPTQGNYVVVKSWATSFSELCGSNTTIYARGGRSTADFIASEDYATAIADTSQYAFLFLGINDINNGVSVADFKTNYTTIVNALMTNHDFVLCVTIPACLQPSASLPNYNAAISEVCGTVSNAFLVDITEASARLNTYKNYGHLSSIGYAMLAGEIAKSVNQTMANNTYFTGQIDADSQ